MNELLQKLESFDIDGGPCESTFAMRLAKEQGWSPEYTRRAIREYKRFIYLGAIHGPVTPSKMIDEVWHLHMIYTESYWQRMCGDVLGQPFHHRPSRGGQKEDSKHRDMFTETLIKYRRVFGEEPPTDIWRSQPAKSKATPEVWIIDKRKTGRWMSISAGLLATALVAAGCTEEGVPVGVSVVVCLMPIVIIAIVGTAISQRKGRGQGSGSDTSSCNTHTGFHGGHFMDSTSGQSREDAGPSDSHHMIGSSHGDHSGQDSGGGDSVGGDSGGGDSGGGSSCGSSCGGGSSGD